MGFRKLVPLAAFLTLAGAAPPKSGITVADMDPACKPCEDFWRYANGGWIDRNPIPDRYPRWGSFITMTEQNLEKLRGILENAARDTSAPAGSNTQKLGAFYASCMDTEALDKRGWSPLKPYFDRIEKIANIQDVSAMIRELESMAISAPIRTFSESDYKNSSQVIFFVDMGGLSLPEREYYLKDDDRMKNIRAEFLKHVAKMFELTGIPVQDTAKYASTVLAFETKLANARMTLVNRRNPDNTYNKSDLASLQAMTPGFSWKALLDSEKVPLNVGINIEDPGALKGFGARLSDTPLEDWKIYLRWRLLQGRGDELSKPFRDETFHFRGTVLNGTKEERPRWQICSDLTDTALGEVLGQEFVKKYFPPEAKKRMLDLVEKMRETLGEEIRNATWLTPQTKKNAVAKLSSFLPKIGYPDKWRDYSGLKVVRDDFFANVSAANEFEHAYNLSQAGKPVDRGKWAMTPPTVNAYYNPSLNEIVFPAGILQPPFFDMEADDAANYGAIGAVIGHEMGHGFDDQGSKFDAQGNLENWWTDEDKKKFEERTACIIDQFDTLDVGEGLRHNGRLVTGEALGDIGGLTLAYRAYHRALAGKQPPTLDGFTGDQRFFIAFARVWGMHERPEYRRRALQTDPHPLAKYRSNATLANFAPFAQAFACKRGDPMVRPPEKQCKLW